MRFMRISPSEVVNLEQLTRIETYQTQEVSYLTLHFVGSETYRCTEEESEYLMKRIAPLIEE